MQNKKYQSNRSKNFDFIFYIPMIVFSYLFLFISDKIGIDFTSNIKFVFAIIILSIYPTFVVAKSFSSSFVGLIKSEYYKFHESLGFQRKSILRKFTIKHFSLGYLTFFENLVIYMFGFIYFVESPFSINGVGNKFIIGVQRFDYPLIIGFCIVSIILFSLINIIVGFIQYRIDPRKV